MTKRKHWILGFLLLYGLIPLSKAYSQEGAAFDWAVAGTRPPEAYRNAGNGVAVDCEGNVYHIGTITSISSSTSYDTVKWGGVPLVTTGLRYPSDPFVSKFDAKGKTVWVKQFRTGQQGQGLSIALDHKGHVYVTGLFADSIRIDTFLLIGRNPGAGAPNYDAFVAKLDTSGSAIWVKQLRSNIAPGAGHTQTYIWPLDINTDTAGNSYLTGWFRGGIALDTFYWNQLPPYGNQDAFMTKIDADGHCKWITGIRGLRTNSTMEGWSIAADLSGSVYAYGQLPDSVRMDNTTFGGVKDMYSHYIVKLNGNSGKMEWVRILGKEPVMTYGGMMQWYPFDRGKMTVDRRGHIITTGTFNGKVNFNPSDNPADTFYLMPASDDINIFPQAAFVLKLDTTGEFIWAKAFQARRNGYSKGTNLTTDKDGNIFTTGVFGLGFELIPTGGAVDFDPGNDSLMLSRPANHPAAFITKLDPDGKLKWVEAYGGVGKYPTDQYTTEVMPMSVAVSFEGQHIYTTGQYYDSVDFDPGPGSFIASPSPTYSSYNAVYLQKLIDTSSAYAFNGSVIDTATDCNGFTINGETFTTEGTHYTTFRHWTGCDSMVTINLTLILPEPQVTIEVDTLRTLEAYKTYQWMKDGELIPGATDRNLTVSENGDYRVIVTDESGCSDTSAVYPVTNQSSIQDAFAAKMYIYPNPAEDVIYIKSPVAVRIALTGVDGRLLCSGRNDAASHKLSVKELSPGIYLLTILDTKGNLVRVEKIVKK